MVRKDLAGYLHNPQNICTEIMVVSLAKIELSPWHAKDDLHPCPLLNSQKPVALTRKKRYDILTYRLSKKVESPTKTSYSKRESFDITRSQNQLKIHHTCCPTLQ
jgi:hypothetical protein